MSLLDAQITQLASDDLERLFEGTPEGTPNANNLDGGQEESNVPAVFNNGSADDIEYLPEDDATDESAAEEAEEQKKAKADKEKADKELADKTAADKKAADDAKAKEEAEAKTADEDKKDEVPAEQV